MNLKEHSVLNLEISVKDLAYYDESISDWIIQPDDYSIYIGIPRIRFIKKSKSGCLIDLMDRSLTKNQSSVYHWTSFVMNGSLSICRNF
ncbi:hypothetical protein [Lutimonas zeaxanthinifaciens]|uniref:hypothetical protein n=1 Tax=Lutimonas zeaxanthinifaciens TaxID=3060215 RepID=UPI003D165B40